MTPSGATVTRLEKAAVDNGFDLEEPHIGDWLAYSSSQAPLRIWLTLGEASGFVVALSKTAVARELGAPILRSLPRGAEAALAVEDIPALHHMVRRAFQLSRTLPDQLLDDFEQLTSTLSRATEIERLVIQRIGQDVFRRGQIEYWEGRCAVTGLAVLELLRASHIRPWAECTLDAERLDVHNGFLLAPHLDAAFDRGYVTIADDGTLIVSRDLTEADRRSLGLEPSLRVRNLTTGHQRYLAWHRKRVFRNAN